MTPLHNNTRVKRLLRARHCWHKTTISSSIQSLPKCFSNALTFYYISRLKYDPSLENGKKQVRKIPKLLPARGEHLVARLSVTETDPPDSECAYSSVPRRGRHRRSTQTMHPANLTLKSSIHCFNLPNV